MLVEKFKQYAKNNCGITDNNAHVLLAISGGLDSVVLAHLLVQAGFAFDMAHVNFQLRGDESERDEQFVTQLAQAYGKKLWVQQYDTEAYAAEHKLSIQVAARNLRYQWFQTLLPQMSATHPVIIATAHHADDNIETLLFHFFRGCGISGLHGILPKQAQVVRPLLFATRVAIAAYAAEHGLQWVEDSSNATEKYARNYTRHQILPLVKNLFANAEENLLGNIERFTEVELIYNTAMAQIKAKLMEHKGNEIHIPVLKLQQQQALHTVVFEICKPYGFTAAQTGEVIKLLTAANGSHIHSHSHRIIRNRNWLIIAPLPTLQAQHIVIDGPAENILFQEGSISVQLGKDATPATDAATATLDANTVEFPLLLRRLKTGDYFYPLGMTKKKKISRFLIDQKLSKTEKEKVWVIESNKRIVWVVGHRIDNRHKLHPTTNKVLTLTWVKYPVPVQ